MALSLKTIAQINAQCYVDDIYNDMRKQRLPQELQTAIISQIKQELK